MYFFLIFFVVDEIVQILINYFLSSLLAITLSMFHIIDRILISINKS